MNGFILPVNFVFGVIGPAQGNTHEATLLGFHDSLPPQYEANTARISRSQDSVTVGSTVTLQQNQFIPWSLRLVWFVVGT